MRLKEKETVCINYDKSDDMKHLIFQEHFTIIYIC